MKVHRLSELDIEKRTATCSNCGPVTIWSRKRSGYQGWACSVARGSQKKPTRPWSKHGLSQAQWDELVIGQSGLCAICEDQLVDPHIDHDHGTGEVRGILCHNCNVGLGHFRDDPYLLGSAIRYLIPA